MHKGKRGVDLKVCVTLHYVKYYHTFYKPIYWQGFQDMGNLRCLSSLCAWDGEIVDLLARRSMTLPHTWLLGEAEPFVSDISSLVSW